LGLLAVKTALMTTTMIVEEEEALLLAVAVAASSEKCGLEGGAQGQPQDHSQRHHRRRRSDQRLLPPPPAAAMLVVLPGAVPRGFLLIRDQRHYWPTRSVRSCSNPPKAKNERCGGGREGICGRCLKQSSLLYLSLASSLIF
jgi:hypothetical protein